MLFNSSFFLAAFLPVALIGFAALGRFGRHTAIGWLAFISIIFYAISNLAFVSILLCSLTGNFVLSRLISESSDHPRRQSIFLAIGVVGNLSLLCYFKYLFPFLSFLTYAGITHRDWGNVLLPLGISFFTLTQLGYLIDLKQGEAEPQSLVSYALFVTFFPHLIAGPILHHKEIMPQFAEKRRYGLNGDDFALGLTWFAIGLFKKVMIADLLAPYANAAFDAPAHQSAATAWIGALNYMLELYFDFSGYSDMAIGLARMFSIRFPLNFNSPYKSATLIDFWARWHMTLTRYVTLYVYTPLSLAVSRSRRASGKNISTKAAKTLEGFLGMIAYPTIMTMLVAGIWHGAGLQFVIFGLIFGIGMTLEHAWNLSRGARHVPGGRFMRILSVLRVNLIVLIALIFFRSPSMDAAISFLKDMAGLNAVSPQSIQPLSLAAFLLLPAIWFLPNSQEILGESGNRKGSAIVPFRLRWQTTPAWGIAVGMLLFLALINLNSNSTFLYFRF